MQKWAAGKGLGPMPMAEIVTQREVIRMVEDILAEKNAVLARYETIKKFRLVPEDFTVENGMLTPTMKVKRKVISERHGRLIEDMYAG
jgi:long-chain acyl-CoA synthetase